jgi:hypothetical protein
MSGSALLFKRVFVLLLPFLAAGLAWALIIAPVQSYRAGLEAELDAKNDLAARYRRLIGQREAFKGDLAQLERAKDMNGLFYSAANGNAAAALLQQKLSGIVTASGGQIRLARVEAKPKAGPLERFGMTLTFAVSTAGLSKILLAVEGERPVLLVDSLAVRGGPVLARLQTANLPAGPGTIAAEEPALEVSLTVSGLLVPKG